MNSDKIGRITVCISIKINEYFGLFKLVKSKLEIILNHENRYDGIYTKSAVLVSSNSSISDGFAKIPTKKEGLNIIIIKTNMDIEKAQIALILNNSLILVIFLVPKL